MPGTSCQRAHAIPVMVDLGEAAGLEERHHGNGGKPCINHWKASACGLFLHVFEAIDVSGDAWVFRPPVKHGSLEMDNLHDFKTSTAHGKMVEVCSDGHLVEKGHGILEGQEPRFLNYHGEENAELALDNVDETLEF